MTELALFLVGFVVGLLWSRADVLMANRHADEAEDFARRLLHKSKHGEAIITKDEVQK